MKYLKNFFFTFFVCFAVSAVSQQVNVPLGKHEINWIRPLHQKNPSVWGIRNGIVFGLWPFGIETAQEEKGGGPRGLIRVGCEFEGNTYLINYIAIEPVVNGEMEFSEISPSRVDERLGKLMWAGDQGNPGKFSPSAITPGVITHPDPANPAIEQLTIYVYMEQFKNGAHPFVKITIRSDRPEELGLEIYSQAKSQPMQRCALTATMGNYARLRLLYLKDKVVNARDLYKGFDDIDFVEKEAYGPDLLLRDKNNDFIVIAASDEIFSDLSSWPQENRYYEKWHWRYRPFFKVTQYWRKESSSYDPSLEVRVNGRSMYWSGGSQIRNNYIHIPGGPAFENFELREKYYPGQKFYFGITRKTPQQLAGKGDLPAQ